MLGKDFLSVRDALVFLIKRIEDSSDYDSVTSKTVDNGLKPMTIRLGNSEYQQISRYAVSHGWSLSKEIRFRLAHTLNDNFDVFDNELKELYSTRSAIDRVGRNIRHIIVNNQKMILDKSEFSEDIKEVILLTTQAKEQLDNYIKLCGGRKISGKFRREDATKN